MTLDLLKLDVTNFMTLDLLISNVINFMTLNFLKLDDTNFMTLDLLKLDVTNFMTLDLLKSNVINFMTLKIRCDLIYLRRTPGLRTHLCANLLAKFGSSVKCSETKFFLSFSSFLYFPTIEKNFLILDVTNFRTLDLLKIKHH